MGILVGFVVGYILGAKTGPERLEEVRHAWKTISNSPDLQAITVQVLGVLSALAPLLSRMATEQGGGLVKVLGTLNLGDLTADRVKEIIIEMMGSSQKAA